MILFILHYCARAHRRDEWLEKLGKWSSGNPDESKRLDEKREAGGGSG